jgi:hypothetical protein
MLKWKAGKQKIFLQYVHLSLKSSCFNYVWKKQNMHACTFYTCI